MRAAREIGKAEAHHWVESLSRQAVADGTPLREVATAALAADERLRGKMSDEELAALFEAGGPARHAQALATVQLAELRLESYELRRDPPWQAWLPDRDEE